MAKRKAGKRGRAQIDRCSTNNRRLNSNWDMEIGVKDASRLDQARITNSDRRRHGSRRGTPPVVTVKKGDTVQRPRFHPHGYPAIGADMKEPTSLTKTTRDHRSFDPAPLSAEYLGPFSRTLHIREEARSKDNPAKRNEIQVARRGGEQRGKAQRICRPVCDLPRNGWATMENRQRQRLSFRRRFGPPPRVVNYPESWQ
uniref:Uncharacterized protein n=1 Tax=Vespula pensylvanica TaxID=30213 RepID=A0A834UFZ9_VESPE|nr:hypothetical protein H0235_000034 [Vespula pensylvanica]